MRTEQNAADRLHEAIEALLAGRPLEEASAEPACERSLLEAAEHMARLRAPSTDGPSPTFVLGLEQQLRADLALMRPGTTWPERVAPLAPPRLIVAGLLAGGLLLGATWAGLRSGARDATPPAVAPVTAPRRPPADGVTAWLAAADRAMATLRGADSTDADLVRAGVADVVAALEEAMREAEASGSPTQRRLVRDACNAAASDLDRMSSEARGRGAVSAVWLAEGAAALLRRIAAVPPVLGWLPPSPSPPAGPTTDATETAGAPVAPAPQATATRAATETATEPLPVASTPTPPASHTPLPVVEPPRTSVPPPATSTALPLTTLVPSDPGPIDPTNTPDRWPATSTPLPHATEAPGATAPAPVRPTEGSRPTEPPAPLPPTSAAVTP